MGGHEPAPPEPEEARSAADRHLAPFFEDSALWPLVAVIAMVGVTCLSALIISGVMGRNLFALAALLGLFWMSVDWIYRDLRGGHFRTISRCALGLWLLSGLASGALAFSGFV